jgi:hypothetical protein
MPEAANREANLRFRHVQQPLSASADSPSLGSTSGPRNRLRWEAFHRLGVAPEAEPFYAVHADVDPRHGQDWLEHVVAPLVDEIPASGDRMVRGAIWRWTVNAELFDALGREPARRLAD